MEIDNHIQKIVETLTENISVQAQAKIDSVIASLVQQKLTNIDFEPYIQQAAVAQLEKKVSEYNIDSKKLESKIVDKINSSIERIETASSSHAAEILISKMSKMDVDKVMANTLSTIISDRLKHFSFPENSIDAAALNFDQTKISGNNIAGGIITNFSSTGIDDRTSSIALTLLDEATVVENNLHTKDLTVEGEMTVNGKFVVNGAIPTDSVFYKNLVDNSIEGTLTKLDNSLFERYSETIFNKIKLDGLDLNRITLDGKEVFNKNVLVGTINESNLQKVGTLKELQVSGESFLSSTLYTTNGRVGINTIEPSSALSVWDEEIEINLSKKRQNVAQISVSRQSALILSSNNKENLTLETDGSVTVKDLQIGSMKFSVAEVPPSYVSNKGHVVWNANPNPGGPMGWICLGSANWANFGIID